MSCQLRPFIPRYPHALHVLSAMCCQLVERLRGVTGSGTSCPARPDRAQLLFARGLLVWEDSANPLEYDGRKPLELPDPPFVQHRLNGFLARWHETGDVTYQWRSANPRPDVARDLGDRRNGIGHRALRPSPLWHGLTTLPQLGGRLLGPPKDSLPSGQIPDGSQVAQWANGSRGKIGSKRIWASASLRRRRIKALGFSFTFCVWKRSSQRRASVACPSRS
jgi:hypothetical protein